MYDPLNVYRGRYKEFIESIMRERPLNEKLEYCEDHHIAPRCTFEDKTDPRIDDEDNHINLTYREHFIAHKLLAEENPKIPGLSHAYFMMCNCHKDVCSPEEYELGRLKHREALRDLSEESRKKISDTHLNNSYNKGRVVSEDTRHKISKSLRGNTHRVGYCTSESTKEKISNIMKGKSKSESHKRNIAETLSGRERDELTKLHISEGCKKREYHLICSSCNRDYIGRAWNQKYCEECRITL